MSAHTPDPWSVGGSTGLINQIEISPSIGCAYGAGEEVKANARLMAAAPDLLLALKKARASVQANRDSLYECHFQPHTGDVDAAGRDAVDEDDALLSRIDAAIAKATGVPA